MYTVYSKPQCTFCEQAKALLKSKNLAFQEIILDVGQEKEAGKTYMPVADFKAQHPHAKTVPQIFLATPTDPHGTHIGGFNELRASLQS